MKLKMTDSVNKWVNGPFFLLGFLLDLIRGAAKPAPRLAKVRVPVTPHRRIDRPRYDRDGCRW